MSEADIDCPDVEETMRALEELATALLKGLCLDDASTCSKSLRLIRSLEKDLAVANGLLDHYRSGAH